MHGVQLLQVCVKEGLHVELMDRHGVFHTKRCQHKRLPFYSVSLSFRFLKYVGGFESTCAWNHASLPARSADLAHSFYSRQHTDVTRFKSNIHLPQDTTNQE
jgi:hypothetical protein